MALFAPIACNALASAEDRVGPTFEFIFEQHDLFHRQFFVYRDRDAGDQHFFPSGWMGDLKLVDEASGSEIIDDDCTVDPKAGRSCIRLTYPAKLQNEPEKWGGIYWEFPDPSWTPKKDGLPGYDLSKYVPRGGLVQVVFWARGAEGGEEAEFSGMLPDPDESDGQAAKRRKPAAKPIELSKRWKEYRISLRGEDLKDVHTGFSWATNREQNPNGCTIYVDEIRFEFGPAGTQARLREPRFVRSYVTEHDAPKDLYFRNACYSYDNALIVLACCARQKPIDLEHGRLICDAFVQSQANDPFADGRIRNAYSCGDLTDPYLEGEPRLPGWWDDDYKKWFQDHPYFVSTDCGNMAWVALALVTYWETNGRQGPYLRAAEQMCEWIHKNAYSDVGPGGYSLGVDLVSVTAENTRGEKRLTYKSTEHNIDLYVTFRRLAQATGDQKWVARAEHARRFVERMSAPDGGLLTGTLEDGETPNSGIRPLDVNPWALLAFRDKERYRPAIEWAERHCLFRGDAANPRPQGFDFNTKPDGVWWEGTSQMVLAYRYLGEDRKADWCLRALRNQGVMAAPKGAVLAASKDGLTTGFQRDWGEWVYWKRPQTGGSSCWYVFAELGWNPYWGEWLKRSDAVPSSPER